MGRRTRERTEAMANLAVTVLGVAGFLGFLVAARMDDANSSPFDVLAFAWFFIFGAIKACLPWLLSKRSASRRASGDWPVG
jgi:predicted MFS family arabinose efflux permease